MDNRHHNDNSDGDDGDQELLSIGAAIRAALDHGVDPYALAGVLVEGAAYSVGRYVPAREREKAAVALEVTPHERLKAPQGS